MVRVETRAGGTRGSERENMLYRIRVETGGGGGRTVKGRGEDWRVIIMDSWSENWRWESCRTVQERTRWG